MWRTCEKIDIDVVNIWVQAGITVLSRTRLSAISITRISSVRVRVQVGKVMDRLRVSVITPLLQAVQCQICDSTIMPAGVWPLCPSHGMTLTETKFKWHMV